MKHVWSVLCRNYIVDETSKNLSLIDLPNRMSFKGDLPDKRPFEVPLPTEMYFLSTWISEQGDEEKTHHVIVKVIDPTGAEIGNFELDFDMKPIKGHVTIGTLSSMLYTEDGVYFFDVCVQVSNEWTVIASIPIELVHEEAKPEEESEPTE